MGGRSSSFSGARESFHREFAAVALSQGWLRLWLAESNGVPVAAWYGFRFAGIESYYQSGRDPRWDRHAVGAGILEHSIREAFADGMHEYRLLRGDESYKRRYASSPQTVVTVALAGSARGRALVAGVEMLAVRPAAAGCLAARRLKLSFGCVPDPSRLGLRTLGQRPPVLERRVQRPPRRPARERLEQEPVVDVGREAQLVGVRRSHELEPLQADRKRTLQRGLHDQPPGRHRAELRVEPRLESEVRAPVLQRKLKRDRPLVDPQEDQPQPAAL